MRAYLDIPGIVRGTIRSIGYTDSSYGIDGETAASFAGVTEVARFDITRFGRHLNTYILYRADGYGAGTAMILISGLGLWLWRRGTFETSPRYLRLAMWAVPLPFIAHATGWIFTEMGRQRLISLIRPDNRASIRVAAAALSTFPAACDEACETAETAALADQD